MKLKKCSHHHSPVYTLKEMCPTCRQKTIDAHYKFLRLKDAPKTRE